MTEATVCTSLRAALLRLLPGAIIYKHHDLSTKGIPDLSVNWHDRTAWIEVKLMKPTEPVAAFKKHFEAVQLANAVLLERQVMTLYFVTYPINGELRAVLWRPTDLHHLLLSDFEVYNWRRELACGTFHQMIEWVSMRMGLNR